MSDLIIAPGETFPKVIGIEVKQGKSKKVVSGYLINLLSTRIVTLNARKNRLTLREPMIEDLCLVKDFLDRQILDTNGAKVVRVNDLKLARLNEEFHLIAADVGLTGLLRRLKLDGFIGIVSHFFRKRLTDNLIPWNFVEPISSHTSKVKLNVPQSKLGELHPADIAEILINLSPQERAAVMESLDEEKAAEALHDIEPELSLEILDDLPPEKVTSIIEEMSPDDAADILAELPQEKVQEILSDIPPEEAADLKELLRHHEDTAGRLMTTEFVSLAEDLTAEQAIEHLRDTSPNAETIYYLYIVDQQERLKGVLSLRDLIVAKPITPLQELMTTKIVKVSTHAQKEEVAELIAKYDLLALPVVDEAQKLVGIITVDDVVDVLTKQHSKRRRSG